MKNTTISSNVISLLETRVKKVKEISKWAENNPKLSRIIIAFSHILGLINALFFGILLFIFDWGESRLLLVVLANLFFIFYIFYPEVSKKKKPNYLRQKVHDFSLVILSAMVISLGLNNFLTHNNNEHNLVQQPTAKFIVHKPKLENQTTNRKQLKSEFKKKFKKVRKQIKQELRKLKKELKKKNDKMGSRLVKLLLFLLTVTAAVVLGFLILALSCNIACSGQEGLATVILLLGWAGVGWLGVIVIKKIIKMDS